MNRFVLSSRLAVLIVLAVAVPVRAQPLAPDITVTRVINAPVEEVWKAWTTAAGIETFFAPKRSASSPFPAARSNFGSASTIPKARAVAKAASSTA